MRFSGITSQQRAQLELEVIPQRARLQLTRMLRDATASSDHNVHVARMNNVINVGRNVLGLPVSLIEMDDWGDYQYVDVGWIRAELEVLMRRPATPDLVETISDLICDGCLSSRHVNEILEANGCGILFRNRDDQVLVQILSVQEIEASQEETEIPNIRLLIDRMDNALARDDFAGVLHSSANIFETLAKDVIGSANIENQTLASFFERYRRDSRLPSAILDYILQVYRRRNTEPLAGHGSTREPTVTQEEAITLTEMTKAFVRIERQLGIAGISASVGPRGPAQSRPASAGRPQPPQQPPQGAGTASLPATSGDHSPETSDTGGK